MRNTMKALTCLAFALSAIMLAGQYVPVYANHKAAQEQAVKAAGYKAAADARALALCKSGKGNSYIVQGVRCAN